MKTLEERFWLRVQKQPDSEACWLWLGPINMWGYGRFNANNLPVLAHRLMWTLVNGPIPKREFPHDICVLHRCDVRACVNPAHLFLGSRMDNVKDMHSKGRDAKSAGTLWSWCGSKTECKHGHPFDEKNTRVGPGLRRSCRACDVAKTMRYQAKKKAAATVSP